MVGKRASGGDCEAGVERFATFLASSDLLLVDLSVRLPRRRMIVVIAWFCYLEALKKRQRVWRPGVRRGDGHDQCTDVLVQSGKKPMYVTAKEVYEGDKIHFIEAAPRPFAPPIITPPRL